MNWSPQIEYHELPNNGVFSQSNFQLQGPSDLHSSYIDPNQQRENDKNYIINFLLKKQKDQTRARGNCIKISDAKNILLDIISEKKKVEENVLKLDVNDENFNLKWETLQMELNQLNEKILKFDVEVKIPLISALNKRLKKRKAINNRKEKFKAIKKIKQEGIKKKHELIDKLLNERSEEVEAVKHEAALKRQADVVLHEVQKKKYEAKKMLNLLVALAKLRELRSNEEEKRGGYCSKQLLETFNTVVLRFQNLWKKQLEVYKLEEKGLKIMLEENTMPHKKESELETNLLQWEKVLFGDFSGDDLEKLLTLTEKDLPTLIQVRTDWDQFLTTETTPMASSIPLGWVLPPETEDENWKAFTRSSRKL